MAAPDSSVQLHSAETFLHRIFPSGADQEATDDLIERRLFRPRVDCEAFELPVAIDWEAKSRRTDRNWRMQLQSWAMFHPVMDRVDDYADKNAIVAYFVDVARDWSRTYGSDPVGVTTSRMPDSYAWYDMSVGFRALTLAFFRNRLSCYGIPLSFQDELLLTCLAELHAETLATAATVA